MPNAKLDEADHRILSLLQLDGSLTNAELSDTRPQPYVFAAFNGGLILVVAGLLAGWLALAETGIIAITCGGLAYAATTLWTLSYAYRSAVPAASRTELRVLPS